MDIGEREQMEEDIRQFLIESNENLGMLDDEIVRLEKTPGDKNLISSVFRTIHTIKGSCGFFGFDGLSATAHITENILSQVRAEERVLTPDIISLILEAVDQIKLLLLEIETSGSEGSQDCSELIARLEVAHLACDGANETTAKPEAASESSEPVGSAVEPQAAPVGKSRSVPAEAPTPQPERADSSLNDSTIRVDVGLLDKLMNLVGELVLARNQLLQDSSTQTGTLQKTSQRLNLITSELQEGVMKTRMQPIGVVWNKLPRVVRDLAAQCGKQIRIEMVGAETELDKTIIEAIKDPLTHIVRNSCDHGIEQPELRETRNKAAEGRLLLRAFHEGGVVNIEISDDGAGIDPARMKMKALEKGIIGEEQAAQMSDRAARELIFAPGFSTAEKITSISGRGVGMDVVKTNIEKIGGHVEIIGGEPWGTTIRIRIPLTLAIIPGLIVSLEPEFTGMARGGVPVRLREERFVVPQANLLELVRLEGSKIAERIKNLHGTPIFHYRGKLLPLVYLRRILGKPPMADAHEVVSIVVLHAEGRQMGLVVDEIHDTQEIVVKPLARQLKGVACYAGGTIMGDGLPALILDVAGLARLAQLNGRPSLASQEAERAAGSQANAPAQMLLLFRAGRFDRIAVALSLVARLEKVETRAIERAAGSAVLHYRGEILSLVSLASVLDPGCDHDTFGPETVQVIVFTDGVRNIGVVVDEIEDIVEEAIAVRRGRTSPGLLGSAVIGGRITDLLDLHAVVSVSGENWLDPAKAGGRGHRVLLVDPCLPARDMVAEYLSASGYEVLSATGQSDALPLLRQSTFDLVIAAVETRGRDRAELLRALRRDKNLRAIPILGLVEHQDQLSRPMPDGLDFDRRLVRSRRGELLDEVAELIRCRTLENEAQFEEVA